MANLGRIFVFSIQIILSTKSFLFSWARDTHDSNAVSSSPSSMKCYFALKDKKADCSFRRLTSVPQHLTFDTRILNLSHNAIQLLEHNSFTRYVSLIALTLKYNNICKIEKYSFYPLKHLTELDLSLNSFIKLPGGEIFKASCNLLHLYLSNNRMTSIPADIFTWLPKLKSLRLDHNELSRIHITSCSENVDLSINLQNNQFQCISSETFIYPCVSDAIDLDFNPIRQIDANAIASIPVRSLTIPMHTAQNRRQWKELFESISRSNFLQELRVKDSTIDHFLNDIFVTMGKKSLTTLKLELRNLKYLSRMIFGNLSSVSQLYLEFGKLQIIAPEHFFGMNNLRTLSLQENDIMSIRAKSTSKWSIDLQALDLRYNVLNGISNETFYCMNNLTKLDLSYNLQLTLLIINSSLCLRNLQYLNMTETRVIAVYLQIPLLKSINISKSNYVVIIPEYSSFFNGTPILEEIDMRDFTSSCQWCSGIRYMLSGLKHLRYLTLSENSLSILHQRTFEDLSSLEELDISFCNLSTIQPGAFVGLRSLRILHLEGNILQYLSGNTFGDMKQLAQLHVDLNILTGLEDNLFVKMPLLSTLTLSSNKLLVLNQTASRQRRSTLIFIDISNNPVKCDCDMKWLFGKDGNFVRLINTNQTRCSEASLEALRGKPIEFFNPEVQCIQQVAIYCAIPIIVVAFVASVICAYHSRWKLKYNLFLLRFAIRDFHQIRDDRDKNDYEYDINIMFIDADEEWARVTLRPGLEERLQGFDRITFGDQDFLLGRHVLDAVLDVVQKSLKTVLLLSRVAVLDNWFMIKFHMVLDHVIDRQTEDLVVVFLEDIPDEELPFLVREYLNDGRPYVRWVENEKGQKYFWAELIKILTINVRRQKFIPNE